MTREGARQPELTPPTKRGAACRRKAAVRRADLGIAFGCPCAIDNTPVIRTVHEHPTGAIRDRSHARTLTDTGEPRNQSSCHQAAAPLGPDSRQRDRATWGVDRTSAIAPSRHTGRLG